MRKFYLLITVLVTVSFFLFTASKNNLKKKAKLSEEEEEGEIALYDRMDLAWKQEVEMTMDRSTGRVPKERLVPAMEYMRSLNATQRSTAAISNINWVNVGPKNYGGRSRALCIDLNDATRKTAFIGSVGGGLWKTTDITATEPNWQPVNDLMGSLAISSIAQDSATPQTIYFGTGEGYGNSDAARGLGVWKSTNGGTTWNQLSATNNSSFYFCQKVLVTRFGYVMVATSTGLYRSLDGGTTFTKVLGTGLGITGASTNFCYDVEQAANGVLYASLSGSLHKSIDGGNTWSSALPIGITASRIEIGLAPNNSNYVYVLCEYAGVVAGIALSTNAGTSFTTKTEPADADTNIPSTDFSRSQAWYDLTIAVDPNNADIIYVGGVDLFKSANGGTTWQQISHWYGGFGFQNVHADQHNIIFEPNNSSIVYFLNDGGIFRTVNGTATIPTIISKNANYATLQFYACAMSPAAGSYNFMAGAQDNGTHKFTQPVIQNTTQVTGGDGAFCHIDQNQFQYWFSSYVYNNYYRSTDGGATFTSVSHGDNGRFINPTDYDDQANILYCARNSNEYLRWDNPQTGSTFTTITLSALGGQVSAVKVSPNTNNRVFLGTGGGRILRVDNANTATPTATNISTGLPAEYLSCIEVETGNDNHILVTFSGYGANSIWETTNGGTSWTSVEGNLPDMPVRWALFNPTNNDQAIIATELGVWSTDNLNGTSTVWGSSNAGLANVRVDMLQIRPSDKMLIAATHGRGLYYSGVFAAPTANFTINSTVAYEQVNVSFINNSLNASSYLWDFGDGTTSTAVNPTKKYTTLGIYNITLTIDGGASSVIKAMTILPRRSIPYLVAMGGDFESASGDFAAQTISGTGWAKGSTTVVGKDGTNSGANAWLTGFASTYVNNSEAYLYTPVYSFLASGSYDFSFYTKYNCETDYDGFRVEFSIDTGKVWQPLGTSVLANWYNSANSSGTTIFPNGQAFFSGNFGTSFAKKNYNVSALAGNNSVCFRFAFKTDEGVTGVGAVVDDVEVTGPTNNVPLQLLNFSGKKKENTVLLNWLTTQEKNVDGFLIERSFNGSSFNSIAKVAATNGWGNNNYNYTDNLSSFNSINTVYYRIKMIDKDGSNKTSNAIKINLKGNDNIISVYPNPFLNTIQIDASILIKSVDLVDMNGKIVYNTRNINNGKIVVPSTITKGNYILRITTSNNEVISKKVTKQ